MTWVFGCVKTSETASPDAAIGDATREPADKNGPVVLPAGTVTLLFTDIEGSTRLWEQDRAAMSSALARHDEIVRSAVVSSGGVVFATGGDGFAAAFQSAPNAVRAALDAQTQLQRETPDTRPVLPVRMAIHTGDVLERGGDYFGPPLNRCARLMAVGHGGQILCSGVTASLASDQLPNDAGLLSLGQHVLRDLSQPEYVFQVTHPYLRADLPRCVRSTGSEATCLFNQLCSSAGTTSWSQ